MSLAIPDVAELDTLGAALAYAEAGWYLLPTKRGSKHPGSVVGFGWNDQSSREPAVIIAWFAGTDYGIALHCGRSGAVVIDLDAPENMPAEMRIALLASDPPMQATRSGDDLRGHYLYLQPEGRVLGNGTGQLGAGWGDVRGLNGVIIVAPSVHEAPDGEYRWMQTGPLAPLPVALADKLHDASPSEDAASDAEIAAFILAHSATGSSPHLADAWLATFRKEVGAGESRHGKAISIGAGALKEAAAGLFSAAEFIPALHREFIAAAARPPLGGKQGSARTGKVAESEWAGILAWAVAQARCADHGATLARLAEHAPGMPPSWVHGATVPQAATVPTPLIAPLSLPQSPTPVPVADELHAQLVVHEVAIQRARREAKRLLDDEEHAANFRVPPSVSSLTAELALPDEAVAFRVEHVLPIGGNVLLTAQFKAGKTTLINNFARALADGLPFLGEMPVSRLAGDERIGLWNYEVSRGQYRTWLRDTGIENTDAVAVFNVRGYTLPITVPKVADFVVAWLIEHAIRVWVIDPFARAFTGDSENDNALVGRWLDAIDVIKERAGVSELVLPTHTGRTEFAEGAERARGATRLDDWADVRWMLNKNDLGERFFMATGRDVEYPERQLSFDDKTRRLFIVGGDRKANRADRVKNAVFAVVSARPGIGSVELRTAVADVLDGARGADVDAAAKALLATGHLRMVQLGKTKGLYPDTPRPFGNPS